MGYAMMIGECFVCHGGFTFNPHHVPSFRDSNGVRQPVCRTCINRVNEIRIASGIDAFIIHSNAYEACDESELG